MKHGFIRVAAATVDVRVADVDYNTESVKKEMMNAEQDKVKVLVFPELCLTAYTCQDLFLQSALIKSAADALQSLVDFSKNLDVLSFIGLPFETDGKLYNTVAAVQKGKLLALIPKTFLPNYSEFYEARHFTPGPFEVKYITVNGESVPFGTGVLLRCSTMKELVIAAEICEDVWVPQPPSIKHAMAGATLIVNCSASDETVGKDTYRTQLISGQSARLVCGYVYANAGEGESTQDLVFGGQDIIAENGTCLKQSEMFVNGTITADIDLGKISAERRRMTTFHIGEEQDYYEIVDFAFKSVSYEGELRRFIDSAPFVPDDAKERDRRCNEILNIQAMGLKKRLKHTGCSRAVLGISGGLDSTLALLVTARAFDMLSMDRSQILAVTMPCFGTTDRTYQNACRLTEKLGAQLREISIKEAVNVHFRDISHDENVHDVTYENSQARERTQILMDIANQENGMVIGTGDLSELALGWATYNGDHMSMYAVNASVPKTLVRHLVRFYADTCHNEQLSGVLLDVLDTPVSPELLPPSGGTISQKTEDLVGPYELHDFFLYQILRFGFAPAKVYDMAKQAFKGIYEADVILKWLKVFYRRFFSQQFKRSCLPDGPKVGSVAVSPRGDLRMPSDACSTIWMKELDKL